jgi:hypothetical protein
MEALKEAFVKAQSNKNDNVITNNIILTPE